MASTPPPKSNASSTVPSLMAFPSVEDVAPAEEGGPIARTGFNYQDEIAVGFLLEMLEDPTVEKVHCETHDDIVVLRRSESTEMIAEFVQVKGSEEDKFMSVADICLRTKAKVGSSIYETSLARDKHCERSYFRMVTLRPVVKELRVLTYERNASNRKPDDPKLVELATLIEQKCPGAKSAKGQAAIYWVENCLWEERQTQAVNRERNLLRVMKLSAKEGRPLLPEQADAVLGELRAKAKAAGDAKWSSGKENKIIERAALRQWWEKRLQELIEGARAASGGKLADKMYRVPLPSQVVELAKELRRDYSSISRISRYSPPEDEDELRSKVKAKVQSLQSSLICGELSSDGAQFHNLCLKAMDQINGEQSVGAPDRSAFLKGCMYDIADRCLLRFEKGTP
jgi:Cap4 dsDNA endonuclease